MGICTCGTEFPDRVGGGNPRKYCSEACKQHTKRVTKQNNHVKRLREQRSKLYIVPCSLDTANAFVTSMHRHNKAVPGAKFCIGLANESGILGLRKIVLN